MMTWEIKAFSKTKTGAKRKANSLRKKGYKARVRKTPAIERAFKGAKHHNWEVQTSKRRKR